LSASGTGRFIPQEGTPAGAGWAPKPVWKWW